MNNNRISLSKNVFHRIILVVLKIAVLFVVAVAFMLPPRGGFLLNSPHK